MERYHWQYSCQRMFTLKATKSLDSQFTGHAGGHSNKLTIIINQNMRHSTEQEARTLPKFKKNKSATNWSKLQEILEDRRRWRAAVHGATKSQTWLNDWKTMESKTVRRGAGRFPAGPVVRAPRSHAGGTGSVPGQGTQILCPVQ